MYGPHTVDLMSLDANAMKAANCQILRRFTPCPMSFSAGVDIFAQDLSKEISHYVYSPFGMVFPVITLLKKQYVRYCSCIIPYIQPVLVWLLSLTSFMQSSVLLGRKGEKGVS